MDYTGVSQGRACFTCGQTTHQVCLCRRERDESTESYNCGGEGHMSRDCPEGPKDTKTCYRCGQPGHISRELLRVRWRRPHVSRLRQRQQVLQLRPLWPSVSRVP
ncbi:hypothetical protein BT67DRAFT_26320 [Trichocladium antarcticum]|uniref:CCHC-type domain-containing protein n=1 Tax=Trichocladium antarcticum TaxID=1450529 RepID=A0AAN6UTE4_9PEZI|nr:hypothetical protein BT67DRAFT_26320 [Trichocladium antarcticum]